LPDSAEPLGKLIYLPNSVELTGKLQTVREMNILLSVTTVKKNYIPPTGKIISLTVQNRQDISTNTLFVFNRQKIIFSLLVSGFPCQLVIIKENVFLCQC
jgi:hypothetical protein